MSDLLQRELLRTSNGLRGGRSYRLLSRHDAQSLQIFYQSLSGEERHLRFGGAVSDCSIAQYCAGIDWDATILIARAGPYCLEAVATIVRIDPDRVENAIACPVICNPPVIIPALLRLSVIAARATFGASRMVFVADPVAAAFSRGIGDVTIENDQAILDLSRLRLADPSEAADRFTAARLCGAGGGRRG